MKILYNKSLLMVFLLTLLFQLVSQAQEMTVKSMVPDPSDNTASLPENLYTDNNDDYSGLVKVMLDATDAEFEGWILERKKHAEGEYWLFMAAGSNGLIVRVPGYLPLKVNFRQYDDCIIKQKQTYVLTITMPQTDKDGDGTTGAIDIKVVPANADVWIDGKKVGVTPNLFRNILPGSHNVEIRKDGFEPLTRSVTVKAKEKTTITASLTYDGERFVVNGIPFNMIKVSSGTFTMGMEEKRAHQPESAKYERPIHQVTLSEFYIGETEVTQALWQAVMLSNPSKRKGDNLPVENVNWGDCQLFIEKLNKLTGRHFRLPTEAEWEFAARGGNKSRNTIYAGSNDLDSVAWHQGNSGDERTHPVKTKAANELGLYDMSGNVGEWCSDWFGVYSSSAQNDPQGESGGEKKVVRGCWLMYHSRGLYVSGRWDFSPIERRIDLGFRLALDDKMLEMDEKDNPAMKSDMAILQVECPVLGARIFINDKQRGFTPRTVRLPAGEYKVEIRHDGYRNLCETVTLQEKEVRKLSLPALEMIAGSINVRTTPAQADVYIDGKKVGTTPNVFNKVIVGNHVVEVVKDGYQSLTKNVTVEEKKQATLIGSLSLPVKETFTVNGVSFVMIRLKSGSFMMGATEEQGLYAESDEKPVHQVTLSDYSIGETEVTQALWQAVMGNNPSHIKGDPNLPVEKVNWDECQMFIEKLNQLTGKKFRLPTEAEWEYAARGGRSHGMIYAGSNDINAVAWYRGTWSDEGTKLRPVKLKAPNELGLYDMSGNVTEWCHDINGDYSSEAQTNPRGPESDMPRWRIARGGDCESEAKGCRVSRRCSLYYSEDYYYVGLRLAM